MSSHFGVFGRCPIDHAVDYRAGCIELEVGQNSLQSLRGPGDEVFIADQVRAILSLRPGATEIPNRAVAQEVGEVGVGFNVRGPEGAPSEFLIEGKHRTVDVAKISDQKDLLRLRIKLPDQPG